MLGSCERTRACPSDICRIHTPSTGASPTHPWLVTRDAGPVAEVFEVSEAIRSQTQWPNWLPSIQVAGLSQPWDEAGTLEALIEVTERTLVDRREFLALIGSELLLPIYTWRLNPGPLLVYQAHGQQVSPGLVDELERLISVRRHMDDEHGGGALVNMLHSDLRFVTEMLKHSRYKEPIGRRLYAAAAELARLAGWAAFDSGRHAAAQQYYFAGIRAASALGDHALAVNIIGFLGIQAYSTGRLADAVQLMDVAAAESRKTPAIVQAMTWARTGRAYAKVGDKSTARAALNKSSEFLGKTVSGDTPPWAYWVDETRLTAQSKHSGRRGWLRVLAAWRAGTGYGYRFCWPAERVVLLT